MLGMHLIPVLSLLFVLQPALEWALFFHVKLWGRPKWKFWDGSACGNPLRFVIPFWSTTTRPPQEPPNGSSPRIGSLLKFGVELGDLFSLLWCLQWSPPTVIVTMRMTIPLHRAKRRKTFCWSPWSFTFNCSGGIIPSVVSLQHRQKK